MPTCAEAAHWRHLLPAARRGWLHLVGGDLQAAQDRALQDHRDRLTFRRLEVEHRAAGDAVRR